MNELIEALRYCADYGGYKGCSKCPINSNGMVCGTHKDAIARAADAIERLELERDALKEELETVRYTLDERMREHG